MSHLTLPPRARRISHAPSHVIVSSQVSNALRKMAPRVKLLTGDGSQLVPEVLNGLAPDERERTMVIFDGEKRFRAWSTWEKVRDKAAMAIFDDSNIGKEGKQVESRTLSPPIVPICHARSVPMYQRIVPKMYQRIFSSMYRRICSFLNLTSSSNRCSRL